MNTSSLTNTNYIKFKTSLSLLLTFLCLAPVLAAEEPQNLFEEENYCHDLEAEAEWRDMICKYPDDLKVQTLHALRIGLCAKVDAGQLTISQATSIFEAMRGVMVDKAFQEQVESIDKDTVL